MEEKKELNETVAAQSTESAANNNSNNNSNSNSSSNSGSNKKTARYQKNYRPKNNDLQNAFKKRVCKFCAFDATMPSYKNPESLKRFISERGKILPQRVTGACAKHQRLIAREIKRARILAYLPFDRK